MTFVSGFFIVNSFYRSLIGHCKENNYFRWIWTTQSPLKKKLHMWLAYHDRLLTAENLAKGGIHFSSLCKFFWGNPETASHIFLLCPFILQLWVPERSHIATNLGHPLLHLFGVIGEHLMSHQKWSRSMGLCCHCHHLGCMAWMESKGLLN